MSAPPQPERSDLIAEIGAAVPVLGQLAREVTAGGLTFPTSDAVLRADLDRRVLEPFFDALIERAHPDGVLGLALLGMELVDRSGVGQAPAEAAATRATGDAARMAIAGVAKQLHSRDAVVWWHGVQTRLREDRYYYHFLYAHSAVLLPDLDADVAEYLLHPDRGPGHLNIDSVELAIRRTDRPQPYVQRWVEWLEAGQLDGRARGVGASPSVHYACLVTATPSRGTILDPVRSASLRRARTLCTSPDESEQLLGARHLVAMLERRVPFAGLVLSEVVRQVEPPTHDDVRAAWPLLERGLVLLQLSHDGDERADSALTELVWRVDAQLASRQT